MKDKFDNLTYLGQTRKLREFAEYTLKSFPIKATRLEFINHGENATYRIHTNKKHYLLRIHCRSFRTKQAIKEELKWLAHLNKNTELEVQSPLKSQKGNTVETISHESLGHERNVSILEWCEGSIRDNKNESIYNRVGQLVGKLHNNPIKAPNRKFWDADGLIGKNAVLGPLHALDSVFPQHSKEIEEYRKHLHKKLKAYQKKNPNKIQLIHSDLHFGNMLWNKGKPIPIDFDDCGVGIMMNDLAVSLAQSSNYFKRIGKKEAQKNKHAMLEGYQQHSELTKDDIKILPYMIATRELGMMGWLHERSDNPFLREHLKKHIKTRLKKTKAYIKQADNETFF
jgi:Ser/Thr protein kinase RdoA (MazF antagonist)